MCRQIPEDSCLNMFNPEPLTRNYRRIMKPRLPRKVTASGRINLNRFWNELEEFYNRYDQRTEKPVVKLPEYTTDTFDHKREAAENELNEVIEIDDIQHQHHPDTHPEVEQGQTKVLNRQRLASEDIDLEVSDEDSLDDSTDEVFLWNLHEKSTPRPPRTLLDLIHRLSM